LSLNDPQWGRGSENNQDGKRPKDGPPDLDQLWRDFNQKLSKLFGQKTGGDGGGFTPDAAGAKLGVSVIAAVFLFLWLVSGFFIVQEGRLLSLQRSVNIVIQRWLVLTGVGQHQFRHMKL